MDRVVREYTKIEIGRSMLDTTIKIYLDDGDRLSVLPCDQLANGHIDRSRAK